MNKRIIIQCVVGAFLGLLLLVPAHAGIHFQSLGTAAPPDNLGGVHVTPFNAAPQTAIADFTDVASIPGAPVPGYLVPANALNKRTVPASWPAWSHGYAGPVFYNGSASMTLTLPPGVTAFYAYADPAVPGTFNVAAVTMGGATSGPVAVAGDSGAAGFGFYTDGADTLATVTITADSSAGGICIGEFGCNAGAGWAVIANLDLTISTVDLSTSPPTIYGPFLAGQLGDSSGVLGGVAVTPDGRYALVSYVDLSFGDTLVYRVDISNPAAPAVTGSLDVGTVSNVNAFGEVAVAPGGDFALVPGAGGSNEIAAIDLSSFTLEPNYALTTGVAAGAVAIAPDNQTAVVADAGNNQIIYGIYDPGSGFISEHTLPTAGIPYGVAISPDGRTVLVANIGTGDSTAEDGSVSLYQITAPGVLEATGPITGLPHYIMGLAFSPTGSHAYVESFDAPTASLFTLDITGPGTASLAAGSVSLLPSNPCWCIWNPNALVVSPDGSLIVGDNTIGVSSQAFDIVRTSNHAVSTVPTTTSYPWAAATFSPTVESVCPGIALLPASAPSLVAGTPYSQTFTVSGGAGPYTIVLYGALPSGMGFVDNGDGTATLSGTPAQTGDFSFSIAAQDSGGCWAGQSYTLTAYTSVFHDDGNTSALCIDSTTGAFQWSISGGRTYTGTLNVYNGGVMFWSKPGASQYVYFYYDPNNHMAWGYLYDYTTGVYSSLFDSNTLNNPPGCSAVQPET